MKTKLYLGCLLATTLLTTSCSDFLTEDPKGKLTPSNYFVSQDALNASVYSLYTQVNGTQTFTNMMYPQWQGDDMTANPASNKQAVAELDAFSANNNNKGVQDAWARHYLVVKAANLILDNAANTPVSEEEINVALGQAYFWRAYAYYYLVRIFGPLPLVTSSEEMRNDIPLSSVEEVYKLILSDLGNAKNMLPTSYSIAPRNHNGIDAYVTRQAVQATLAAVYMSMAGYPLNRTELYADAAAEAKDVINHESTYGFYLDSDWSHVYSMGHNYNKETVLGLDFSPVVDWATDSQLSSCNRFESLGDGGWGDAWGEIAFWKRYPEGPRKDAVYAPKITFQEGTNITAAYDWWEIDENGNPRVAEYHPMFTVFSTNCDPNNTTVELAQPYDYMQPNYTGMCNGHRHRLIRYSEVLLWYAESAARAGEDLTLAKQCLRRVRERAVNDPDNVTLSNGVVVSIDNMSAEQLAEACYIEHGWEVAGYWVAMVTRRSDEFRMNELKKNFDFRVANPGTEIVPGIVAKESVTVSKATWAGDNSIYIPYPDTEVEKNPNLNRDLMP